MSNVGLRNATTAFRAVALKNCTAVTETVLLTISRRALTLYFALRASIMSMELEKALTRARSRAETTARGPRSSPGTVGAAEEPDWMRELAARKLKKQQQMEDEIPPPAAAAQSQPAASRPTNAVPLRDEEPSPAGANAAALAAAAVEKEALMLATTHASTNFGRAAALQPAPHASAPSGSGCERRGSGGLEGVATSDDPNAPDGAKNYTLWRELVGVRASNETLELELETAKSATDRMNLILSGVSERLRAQMEVLLRAGLDTEEKVQMYGQLKELLAYEEQFKQLQAQHSLVPAPPLPAVSPMPAPPPPAPPPPPPPPDPTPPRPPAEPMTGSAFQLERRPGQRSSETPRLGLGTVQDPDRELYAWHYAPTPAAAAMATPGASYTMAEPSGQRADEDATERAEARARAEVQLVVNAANRRAAAEISEARELAKAAVLQARQDGEAATQEARAEARAARYAAMAAEEQLRHERAQTRAIVAAMEDEVRRERAHTKSERAAHQVEIERLRNALMDAREQAQRYRQRNSFESLSGAMAQKPYPQPRATPAPAPPSRHPQVQVAPTPGAVASAEALGNGLLDRIVLTRHWEYFSVADGQPQPPPDTRSSIGFGVRVAP